MADTNMPDLSGLISTLMADERFTSLLSEMKGAASEASDTAKGTIGTPNDNTPEDNTPPPVTLTPDALSKLSGIASALSGKAGSGSTKTRASDRTRLLTALKPFMSEKRRAAIDSVISLSGIAEIFQSNQ